MNNHVYFLYLHLIKNVHFLDFTLDFSLSSCSSNSDFMTSSNVWLTVPNFASLECVSSLTFIDLNSGGSFTSIFKKSSAQYIFSTFSIMKYISMIKYIY